MGSGSRHAHDIPSKVDSRTTNPSIEKSVHKRECERNGDGKEDREKKNPLESERAPPSQIRYGPSLTRCHSRSSEIGRDYGSVRLRLSQSSLQAWRAQSYR